MRIGVVALVTLSRRRPFERSGVGSRVTHRAVARIDMRLVPDMKKDDAVAALKGHLARHGFGDIEVNAKIKTVLSAYICAICG